MGEKELRKLYRFDLNFTPAKRFATKQLEEGGRFCSKHLSKIDLNRGNFYTLLPENADLNKIHCFNDYHILPKGKEYIRRHKGKTYKSERVNSLKRELSDILERMFLQEEQTKLVVEDIITTPEDNWIKESNLENLILPDENNLYYYVDKNNFSADRLIDIICQSIQAWHFVFVITKYQIPYDVIQAFSSEMMQEVSDNTVLIGFGAYDGEGFIFWEKKGSEVIDTDLSHYQHS